MTERESKTQTRVMQLLRKNGCYVYKNAQNMYTEKGRPDLTACIPVTIKQLQKVFGDDMKIGIFVGIEMKRPGKVNNISEAQEIVGRQIEKSGGLWFHVDGTDEIEGLLKVLEVNDVI